MKSVTSLSGRSGAYHPGNNSKCLCGAKLGCDVGSDATKIEYTATPPFIDNPDNKSLFKTHISSGKLYAYKI